MFGCQESERDKKILQLDFFLGKEMGTILYSAVRERERERERDDNDPSVCRF